MISDYASAIAGGTGRFISLPFFPAPPLSIGFLVTDIRVAILIVILRSLIA